MENAAEAIKIIGAMLIFVIALSITMYMFTQVRQATAETAKNGDLKLYYNTDKMEDIVGDNLSKRIVFDTERIVGVDEVIAQIYTYYNTHDTLVFYYGTLNGDKINISGKMPLYYTMALDEDLKGSFLRKDIELTAVNKRANDNISEDSRLIYGLDTTDEQTIRKEPWTINKEANKKFVNDLVMNNFFDDSGRTGFQTTFYNKSNGLAGLTGYDSSRVTYAPISSEILATLREKRYNGGSINRTTNYYALKFLYPEVTNGHVFRDGLLNATSARFYERVGVYSINPTFAQGQQVDSALGAIDQLDADYILDNDIKVENPKAEPRRIIQYIYITN